MITSRESLIAAVEAGQRFKYVFFWGHQPGQQEVTESCMSQWSDHDFVVDDVHYKTAEHFMMGEKARLFGDEQTRARILAADHPAEAKKLGRQVKGFTMPIWTQHRMEIVVRGNIAKFTQHARLQDYLLNTGDRILVEASPKDQIWGIGLGANDDGVEDPRRWKGLNLLGFSLIKARGALAAEAIDATS